MRVVTVIATGLDADGESLTEVEVGGESSFDLFYNQQRRSLIALAYAVSGSRMAAEDLAQEALIAAYRSWDQIRTKDNPGTWVRRILLNKASSAYRRRVAEAKALGRRSFGHEQVFLPEVTGEIEMIWSEIRRLPRRQLQVVALASLEGRGVTEIAQILDISKESVNTHMRRARTTLARRLHLEEETR